jgi:hypothetical protein
LPADVADLCQCLQLKWFNFKCKARKFISQAEKKGDTMRLPKGAIIAYYATTGELPPDENWALCDGKTPEVPDLRGLFIRGCVALADIGKGSDGSDTHSHSYSGTTSGPDSDSQSIDNSSNYLQATGNRHTHNFAGTTGPGSNLPPYYRLVYLMKVTDD